MYFYDICTTTNQPNFSQASADHRTALNNYLKYGIASSDANFGFDKQGQPNREKLAKEKEVKHQTTVQVVNNMIIYTTTFLCCEDDQD